MHGRSSRRREKHGQIFLAATAAVAALAGLSTTTWAADKYYVGAASGATAIVNSSANWSLTSGGAGGAGVPTGSDRMRLNHNDATNRTVLLDTNLTLTGGTMNQLHMENTGTGIDTLSQTHASGFSLSVGSEDIGVNANGKAGYTQSTGTNHANSYISLGSTASTSQGTYNLSGGAVTIGGAGGVSGLFVGNAGVGTFAQTGGSVDTTAVQLVLGNAASGIGIYNLSGAASVLNASETRIGFGGKGTFVQTAGISTFASTVGTGMSLGFTAGSSGTYSISGASDATVAGGASVGGNSGAAGGTGVLNVSGGALAVQGTLKVWNTASTGVNFSAGTLTADVLDLRDGSGAAKGKFNWTGGTLNLANSGWIMSDASFSTDAGVTSLNTFALNPGKSISATGDALVGFSTAAGVTLNQTGGSNSVGGILYIQNSNGSATYNLLGGTIDAGNISIGQHPDIPASTNGLLNMSAGKVTVFDTLKIWNRGTAQMTFSGGILTVGTLDTDAPRSRFHWSAGTLAITNNDLNIDVTGPLDASVTLSGGKNLLVSQSEFIGVTGAGSVTQTQGFHTATNLFVGEVEGFSGAYTLSGSGQLSTTYEAVGYFGAGTFTQNGGTNSVANLLEVGVDPVASGVYNLNGGTLITPRLNNRRSFNWNGGALTSGFVDISDGGVMTLSAGNNKVLKVVSLSIDTSAGSKLNLNDNKLITADPVGTLFGTAYTGITGLIQAGRNGGTLPLWDGSGGIITSQTGATTGNLTSIGVARASDVRPATAAGTALWGGQTITGTDTLVMYTYGGDATLDGKINVDDYIKIDTGIAGGLTGWSNGDFNYDGKVNIDDYTTVIDANIGNQNGVFPTGAGVSGVTAVPEPAGLSMLALLSFPACGRRRRRR